MSNQSEISAATFYWLCPRDVLNQGRQTIALFHYEDPANDSVGEGGNFFFRNSARFGNIRSDNLVYIIVHD